MGACSTSSEKVDFEPSWGSPVPGTKEAFRLPLTGNVAKRPPGAAGDPSCRGDDSKSSLTGVLEDGGGGFWGGLKV